VLQSSERHIVVGRGFISVDVNIRDQRVQRHALSSRHRIFKVLVNEMTRRASLISQRRYQLAPEIVFGLQGIVMGIRSWEIGRICGDTRIAGDRKVVGVIGRDGMGIRRKPV